MVSAGVLFLGPGSSGITGVSAGWEAITMTSTRVPSARSIGRLSADSLFVDSLDHITPARKFRMLLHINPTRQRGKRTGSLARASRRVMVDMECRNRSKGSATYQWRLPLLDRIDFADVNDARLPLQSSRDV